MDYRDRYLTNPVLIILLIIQYRYLYQHFQSLPSVLLSTSFTIRIKVRSITILWSSSLLCVMYIVVTEFNLHMSSVLNVLLFFGCESITLLLTFFIWIYREHEAPVDSLLPRYIFLFRFSIVLLSSFHTLKSKTFLSSFTPIIVVRSPCHLVI